MRPHLDYEKKRWSGKSLLNGAVNAEAEITSADINRNAMAPDDKSCKLKVKNDDTRYLVYKPPSSTIVP